MVAAVQSTIAPDLTGLAALTLAAPGLGAGNGDLVPANSILFVKNANASPMTVTIKMAATVDGQAVADKTVTVGATTNMLIGPFTQNMKQTAVGTSFGLVLLEFSSVTSLTRAYIASPW